MGDLLILNELTQCIRELHRTGHSPATSTNYSCRDGNGKMWITRSGIDKSLMQYNDFIEISPEGTPLPPFETITPSAETGIHCAIYHMFPDTQVILHSHDIHALVRIHLQHHAKNPAADVPMRALLRGGSHLRKGILNTRCSLLLNHTKSVTLARRS